MEMTRRRFASTISFLACRASRSPFCTICTILRNSPISSPVSPASIWISWRCCLTLSFSLATRLFQPFALSLDTRLSQRIELGALVIPEKILAHYSVTLGEPHQAALVTHEALVDVVKLLDQRVDARLIEPQRLHLADDLVLELLVPALLRGRERIVAQLVLDVLVLQAPQPLVGIGDIVKGLEHLGFELGLDGGKRERVLHIVVIVIAFTGRGLAALAIVPVGALGRCLERGCCRGRGRWSRRLRQRSAAGSGPCCRDRLPIGADHGGGH